MAIGAICGWSTYTGPPPPERPRCGDGHRERYMDYRKHGFDEHGGFRCGKCGAVNDDARKFGCAPQRPVAREHGDI